jgi:polyketide synthase Type III
MQILQISTAIPKQEYKTKEMLDSFPCELPESVKQNVLNLGVSKRYLIKHENPRLKRETIMNERPLLELCQEACEKAIKETDLSIKDVDQFIVAYDANPFLSPGLSQLLTRKLGLDPYVKRANIQGEASTAFPKALEIAGNHLAAHRKDHVLLCVSGVSSYWFHNQVQGVSDVMEIAKINETKNTATRQIELRKWIAAMQFFLFGDGVASAIVAKEGTGFEVKKTVEVTNIGKKDHAAGYARLSALNEPFKFGFQSYLDRKIPTLGIKYSSIALRKLLGKKSKSFGEIAKKWAVHTGSEKILNLMTEHHKIRPEKLKESHEVLRDYGNLSGASLPFIVEKIASTTKLSAGDIILMLGYGWGFSSSASLLEYT